MAAVGTEPESPSPRGPPRAADSGRDCSEAPRDGTALLLRPRDAAQDLDIDARRIAASLRAKLFGVKTDPVKIGRFSVLGRIGSGGMGVVYAARDDELGRKVALKLMHEAQGVEAADQARLLGEAQALARLSHPNVAQVYEVGTYHSRVYLAMEFLPGPTLDAWQAEQTRAWAEILAMYLQAGEGLAAAHEQGIVHRDLKPANLRLGGDGRVRVVDFGVARPVAVSAEPGADPWAGLLEHRLTTSGLAGTPAYLSPEQVRGQPVDARSDQYSFCVALYEALYDARPHQGKTATAVLTEIGRGRVVAPPRSAAVPAKITRAIMRGLSRDPAHRFETMPALLAQLRRDRWAKRGPILFGLGVAGTGLLALAVWPRAQPDPCATAGAEVAHTWDAGAQDAVNSAFLATKESFANDAWEQVNEKLVAWTDAWRQQRQQVCRASHVDRAQSAQLHDLRVACLHRARVEVAALVSGLQRPDPDVVLNAAVSVAQLPRLDMCTDGERLRERAHAPEDARVGEIQQSLAEAAARYQLGDITAALAEIGSAVERARALDYGPLLAEALMQRAWIHDRDGNSTAAIADLQDAADLAEASGDDPLLAEIWVRLSRLAASKRRADIAQGAIRRAQSILTRNGGSALDRARIDLARASQARWAGEHEASIALARSAVGAFEAAAGASAPQTVEAHVTLAVNLAEAERHQEALRAFEATREARKALLGSTHPDLARDYYNIGRTLVVLERYDEARLELEAGVELRKHRHLAVDTRLLDLHLQLIQLDQKLGRDIQARLETAAAITADLPHTNWRWTLVHGLLGEAHLAAGRWRDALETSDAVAAAFVEQGNEGEANYWVCRLNRGKALEGLGRRADAIASYRGLIRDAETRGDAAPTSTIEVAHAHLERLLSPLDRSPGSAGRMQRP